MAKYKLKFMFEWSCDTCVWSGNEATKELYGDYDIDMELLPISDSLKKKLNYLVDNFDDTYYWVLSNNTRDKDEDKVMEFEAKELMAYRMLCIELGSEYIVEHCRWLHDEEDVKDNGMFIRKEEFELGYLGINFGDKKHSFYSYCDECIADPLPDIVRLILSLKLGRNYAFVMDDMEQEDLLGIRVSLVNDDEVLLEFLGVDVSCSNSERNCDNCIMENECDYNTEKVKIEGRLSRETCIKMFEDFIKSIVDDVRYPKQYPGYSCLDDKMHNCIDDMVEKALSAMGICNEDKAYNDLYKSIEVRLVNELVSILPEERAYIAQYDKMLREYIVPTKWCLEYEDEERVKRIFDGE